MNDKILILLPNQLYENISLSEYSSIYVIEEPCYFYDAIYKPYRIHKIKIAFLKAAMTHYYDSMKSKYKNRDIQYIEYAKTHEFYKTCLNKQVYCFDPTDFDVEKKFSKLFGNRISYLESPNFLISKDLLKKYNGGNKHSFRHNTFYEFSKTNLNILKNVKNMDKYNRSSPDKFLRQMKFKTYDYPENLSKYYKIGIDYSNCELFSDHIGVPDKVYIYPITHKEAYKHFDAFLRDRLESFGKYQDAIIEKQPFLFHSLISPLLNCGLLCPHKLLNAVIKKDGDVPIEALEGFVRQLSGWREYQRFLYVFKYDEIIKSNLPENKKTFKNWKDWIYGTTGIMPLDEEIKKAMKYGYAHHIVRLMVFLNFMILCEIRPSDIYKWFMEVVCIDAYSWVMISNIYTMGYFWNEAMTKPYLSSSNYILKMSDYKKNGYWEIIWTNLYKKFIIEKPSKYVFFYKRTIKNKNIDKSVYDFLKKYVK
jgi:deoxyribodipyrimidine photolyase-related protein